MSSGEEEKERSNGGWPAPFWIKLVLAFMSGVLASIVYIGFLRLIF